MEDNLRVKGILYIFLVPILLAVITLLSILYFFVALANVLVIIVYTLAFHLLMLFRKNAYTDSEVLDKVQIPNAPPDIVDLLKKVTRTNRLINVNLILVLGKKKKLSQSDLVEQMRKRGIEYSHPAIEKYLSELEEAGIFGSKKAYKKEYYLTPKGEWCYKAVKKCFPQRFFYFIIRHYLGKRTLPSFPQ